MAGVSKPFLSAYLPYVLRRTDQMLSATFYSVLMQYGVARSEWRVLAVLSELGEMSVAELANEALSPQPTVTHALRRLEERGLVIRTSGHADKRQRFCSVTQQGSELTQALIAEATTLQSEALTDAGDLAGLLDQLKTLTSLLE